MSESGVVQFSMRQLPDSVLSRDAVAGPTSWRFDQPFVEPPDGSRHFFTTSTPFVAGKILVFKDGLKCIQGSQYIAHPPSVVELVVAPIARSVLEAWYLIPDSTESTLWRMDELPTGTKDGLNRDFGTIYPYVSGLLMAYRDGRKLVKGSSYDWIELDNRSFRINVAPTTANSIEVTYYIQV